MKRTRPSGLNRKEVRHLTNALRQQLLYQTPMPEFAGIDATEPNAVLVRMNFSAYNQILALLIKAGGWDLTKEDRLNIIRQHEERARVAYADGVDYDLGNLTYGDMVAMANEIEGIEEMEPFRKALEEEIANTMPHHAS